jgi:hypothetical protein
MPTQAEIEAMDEITEQEVEIVARAICAAHGYDPDEKTEDSAAHPLVKAHYVPRWVLLRQQARTYIAAYRACAALGK